MEPRAGEGPVVLDGGGGEVHGGGGFFDTETAEVAEGNDLCFAGVELFQFLQGLVEGNQVGAVFFIRLNQIELIVEFDAVAAAAVLEAFSVSGALDEDTAHGQGGCAEEVAAVFPALGL